jgi:hypothetical protein
MPEAPWYDRLLIVLPQSYRTGIFILVTITVGIFLYVRLNYGFDWDAALASYYFGLPFSLALIACGIIFSVRRFTQRRWYFFWDRCSFHDAALILSGIALGGFALRDYARYQYQGDYKFSKNAWDSYEAPKSFFDPKHGDPRKYIEKEAFAKYIEHISDRPEGLDLKVSISETGSASACHIIRSRLVFPGGGPLFPASSQAQGSDYVESQVHEWHLSKLRKKTICVLLVVLGKTAKVDCRLLLEVQEE